LNSNRADKLRRQVIDGHLAWARDYSSGGKVDQALFHFEKTLQLDPENGPAHNDFGALLANQGKLAEAEIHFRRALVIDPDYALAKRNLKLLTQLRNK
ncbi:MAG: tetratricopeptide repeat protein, partial [Akkermansiaceae bacterium]